jgi:hypothetical protein
MFVISTVGGALLVGALLGLRFKVLALIPVILIGACAIIATGDSLKSIALTISATAVLLQVGYALGLVVRVLAAQHLSPRSIVREPSSKSRRVRTLSSRSENHFRSPGPGLRGHNNHRFACDIFDHGSPIRIFSDAEPGKAAHDDAG